MIWLIAKKDFLNNILSARFIIGFALCLFLIPFSVFINIDDYSNQVRLYQMDRDSAESVFKSVRVYSMLRPEIVKPPEPLSLFSKGINDNLGNRVRIWLGSKSMLAEGRAKIRDNPLLNTFFSIDFSGIIVIIMSLLALIFSYDICTKEKEEGILKTQLSNSISRAELLTGRIIGVLITLLPILTFCYLLSAIIISISPVVSFTGYDWSRAFFLFLASLIYMTVFIFIGLVVSTQNKSSISSIVVCLFIWIFFVFIVPNLSVYLADKFIRTKSIDNLNLMLDQLSRELSQKIIAYQKNLDEPDWEMQWYSMGGRDGGHELYGASRSFFERERQENLYSEPLRIEYADKKWAYQMDYLQSLQRQKKVANRISLISPAAIFRLISSAICFSDMESHERFMERTRQYREEFIQYFQEKNLFGSFSYFTPVPPETFLTADRLVERRTGGEFKTLQELDTWAAKQPSWMDLYKKLRKVSLPGVSPEDYEYLNVSDVPVFRWQKRHLLTGLQSSLIYIAILIFECFLLFYLSFVAFIRYDVR